MATISRIRRTVSDLTVPKPTDLEIPPMAEDLVGWPFGTEEFVERLAPFSSSPKLTPKLRQKFFSGPLHYKNGVTAGTSARSESTLSPRFQGTVSFGGSLETSPLSEVMEVGRGKDKTKTGEREFSASPLSTGSSGVTVPTEATDRVTENGEVAVTSSGNSGTRGGNSPTVESREPLVPNTTEAQSTPLSGSNSEKENLCTYGVPVGIMAGITLQGHGLRRPAGMLPPVPMKLRPSVPQKRRPDPGLQKLHHIINRATMELDENAEFAEVFAKTLAEATAAIAESPRPFSQEQVDAQRYGLPAVVERGDDSEESSQVGRSPMGHSPLGHMPPSDFSMGSVGRGDEGRDDEERSMFTMSEMEAGQAIGGGWPEAQPPFSRWKVALLAFMAGSTAVMLLVGIVLEACSSAGVIYSGSFRQEFFFFLVLAALVTLQALMAGWYGQLAAHSNALLVAWILDAALVSELLTALLSQKAKHVHTVAARSPFICLTFVNLLLVSVLLMTSFRWSRLGDMEVQQNAKSNWQRRLRSRRSFSNGTKKRPWDNTGEVEAN